jgi:threonyl-tRNA synthetase
MFVVESGDKELMAVKPMNCPGHILVFQSGNVKSYRDLPLKYAEFGVCHRNEASGALHGLLRLRAFMQDDGHIFCAPSQIVSETQNFCKVLKRVYDAFGFSNVSIKFSDRPEKRAGSDEVWDIAEEALLQAATASKLTYELNPGGGAFYGPKLEFILTDCLGREWQCGTLQVDFVLPERFKISFVDTDGVKKTPVLIHRALVGSLERFIGILIENYNGAFPFWLAPCQIAICSITSEIVPYALEVQKMLRDHGFRCCIDQDNEQIGYKIRKYSAQKVPSVVILGSMERHDKTISVRHFGSPVSHSIDLSAMCKYFAEKNSLSFSKKS